MRLARFTSRPCAAREVARVDRQRAEARGHVSVRTAVFWQSEPSKNLRDGLARSHKRLQVGLREVSYSPGDPAAEVTGGEFQMSDARIQVAVVPARRLQAELAQHLGDRRR